MRYNSKDGRKVPIGTDIWKYEEGDWTIRPVIGDDNHAVMYVRCPGSDVIRLPLSLDPNDNPRRGLEGLYWHWDGDWDKPTLNPSIGVGSSMVKHVLCHNNWHGFMRNGRLEACE